MSERSVRRILVATDRSETAERAVEWAVEMATLYEAELVVLRVLVPDAAPEHSRQVESQLRDLTAALPEGRARTRVVVHADPPRAIVETAEDEGADVLVVGNVGMSSRTKSMLGNVPNRVSHTARCTVVIVNTGGVEERGHRRRLGLRR